jgi:hypothetical protein
MIIYSVTVNVQEQIVDSWAKWMLSVHLPEVMATGMFNKYQFSRLLTKFEEETGETFNVQYFANSMDNYQNYVDNFAPELQQKSKDKWGDQFTAFRTLLETI